jgi:putative oxidoreductase
MIGRIKQMSLGLLIVRLALGSIFFLHGAQKVLGWFGGPGLQGFVAWTSTLGIPTPLGYLAAFAEFIGGILLFTGIAAELGALMVIPVMIGAVFAVHWSHGYFAQNGGFEYPFNLIIFALAIMVGGPGSAALWDPFRRYRERR